MRELPANCKPANTADVNAIVDAMTAELDEAIGGWKIGFVYSPRQKPFICPMFRSRLFASPARVPLTLTPSLRRCTFTGSNRTYRAALRRIAPDDARHDVHQDDRRANAARRLLSSPPDSSES